MNRMQEHWSRVSIYVNQLLVENGQNKKYVEGRYIKWFKNNRSKQLDEESTEPEQIIKDETFYLAL